VGGLESYATAINNRGVVAGGAYRNGTFEAFTWSDGAVQFLGTLGGQLSFAYAINDAGAVTGVSSTSTGDNHAFIWTRDRGMVDIGPGEAWGINNSGVVVGFSASIAFRWTAQTGVVTLPPVAGGYDSFAFDVNNVGDIVGSSADGTGRHAVLWPREGGGPKDLGTLGGYYSQARAIGDNGVIVGTSSTASYIAPFRWTRSTGMKPLAEPGVAGEAVGVSAAGAVGYATRFNPPDPLPTLCLWPPNGGCHSVATLGGALTGINDRGVIVGAVSSPGPYGFESVVWRPASVRR
jgi:probable HAF family extracellular repeat protein